MSTNSSGSPDLDTRPPEMRRSTIDVWVTRCPACGYCSRGIAAFDERSRPVLESAAYRAQLDDIHYPELASTFLGCAMLLDAIGEHHTAAWTRIHAAWVLDDAGKIELAKIWRGRAADELIRLPPVTRPRPEQPGSREAVIADCLRRAGRGNDALAFLETLSIEKFEEVIRKVLIYEKALIQRGDMARHFISEAFSFENAPGASSTGPGA